MVVLGELGECYLSENNRDYDHYHDDNGVHWGGLQEDKTPDEEYFDECFKKSCVCAMPVYGGGGG